MSPRTLVSVLALALVATTVDANDELLELLKVENGDETAIAKQALKLDDKLAPRLGSVDGDLTYRVSRDNDVSFSRLKYSEMSVESNADRLDQLEAVLLPTGFSKIVQQSIDKSMDGNTILLGLLQTLQELNESIKTDYVSKTEYDALKDELTTVNNKLKSDTAEAISDQVTAGDKLKSDIQKQLDDEIESVNSDLDTKLSTFNTNVNKAVDDKLKPVAASTTVLNALKLTYFSNPKIPVFRWQMWNTHQHGVSWIDENRNSGFGGIHPSQWTDGNYRANQMADDFKFMQRLFIRRGTASSYGATICSDVYNGYSSTDGGVCGALFRIKNTGSSTIRWRPAMTMTSFHGWSETASISLNGQNNYNNNCQYECHFTVDLNIPANGSKNRISTIIFISTSSHPRGHYANQERATVLMFRDNALNLPNGLEYVDDLDTITGRWKI